jgi:hypothetical protein
MVETAVQLFENTEICIYFKGMNFMIYELYLSKTIILKLKACFLTFISLTNQLANYVIHNIIRGGERRKSKVFLLLQHLSTSTVVIMSISSFNSNDLWLKY